MIVFHHLRTHRMSVRLRELTLGDEIAICKLPAERNELTVTEFLRFAARDADAPQERYITDPRLWTVEERTLVVCHYLAQVASDGPDFSVGEGASLSDYVQFDADLQAPTFEGALSDGKRVHVQPLLGIHSEILERLCESRGDWLVGAIACQMQIEGVASPAWNELPDVKLLETIKDRMKAVRDLPASTFEEMLSLFSEARREMHHFFSLNFDDHGVVCEPKEGEAGQKNPARFLASSCISAVARQLFGKPHSPGG